MHNDQIDQFLWQTEQFADIRILRYRVEGFENLSIQQKTFAYYLYHAALAGRDIIYDQHFKYNLLIRKTLEAVIGHYHGDKSGSDWEEFMLFTKRVWFSNGIHHHNSMEKMKPGFTPEYLGKLIDGVPELHLPLIKDQSVEEFKSFLTDLLFDPTIAPKRVVQDHGTDLVAASACNFYENITQSEAELFYSKLVDTADDQPVSVGLNSKLIKKDGVIREKRYHIDGMYGKAIRKIVMWLEKAKPFAETELQRESIEKLVRFYETGNLRIFDDYSISWVKDTVPAIDFVNGFIEVYGDPLGYHGAWQSMLSIRDEAMSKRFGIISDMAAWFEEHSPIDAAFKRAEAEGVSYKIIQVLTQSGDNAPSSAIGVNLPNADWIRSTYGSKSVSLGNIEDAYDMASKSSGTIEEFYLPEQQDRVRQYGAIASKIHTGLHEVIGHGSGRILPGVGTPKETLKSYSNALEEARADLVALYFMTDPVLIEKGLIDDENVGKAEYDSYILNGMMRQLVRVEPGQQLEEAHMRNRQLIAQWVFEKGKTDAVIEQCTIYGKTFFKINDYQKLRVLFGALLTEVQRIKSTGDYEAGRDLVETYGVKVDKDLHIEVLERWNKLGIAPFAGFIQPMLQADMQEQTIHDVRVNYPDDFTTQMMYYAHHYANLPVIND
ncbi:MAG: dipeptidyl peptidase 3 [Bacteroidetes bacterium]|nr:dipeptidyl peptidase 3 [Bacteroidota bacterium]